MIVDDIMRRLGKEIARLFRGQKGFSLFEVLVAVGILGFIGAGIAMAIDTNYRSVAVLDQKTTGMNLAITHVEFIREAEFAQDYSSVVASIVLPSQYESNINLEYSDNGDDWTETCDNRTLQRIIVSISQGGSPVYSMCTYKWE